MPRRSAISAIGRSGIDRAISRFECCAALDAAPPSAAWPGSRSGETLPATCSIRPYSPDIGLHRSYGRGSGFRLGRVSQNRRDIVAVEYRDVRPFEDEMDVTEIYCHRGAPS